MEEINPTIPLRRRNSTSTDIPYPSPPSFDFELVSLKPSSLVAYTSLRDILSSPSNSSSVNLPSVNGISSPVVGDISIRNPLVKRAAWSYLQPTAITSSEGSPGSQLLRRMWLHFSAGLQFLRRMIDWIFQSIRSIPLLIAK